MYIFSFWTHELLNLFSFTDYISTENIHLALTVLNFVYLLCE